MIGADDKLKKRVTPSKLNIEMNYPAASGRGIDEIREKIGVDRGALIKVWLHEKVKEEKATSGAKAR